MPGKSRRAQELSGRGGASLVRLFAETAKIGFGLINKKAACNATKAYAKSFAVGARDEAVDFVKEVKEHWEAATILSFAGIGASSVMGNIVMKVAIPKFIENKFVVPVLSTVVVIVLIKRIRRKTERRRSEL